MMHTCSGLVGPKAKMLKNQLFFKGFLKGAKGQEHSKSRKNVDEKAVFG